MSEDSWNKGLDDAACGVPPNYSYAGDGDYQDGYAFADRRHENYQEPPEEPYEPDTPEEPLEQPEQTQPIVDGGGQHSHGFTSMPINHQIAYFESLSPEEQILYVEVKREFEKTDAFRQCGCGVCFSQFWIGNVSNIRKRIGLEL